MSKLTDQDEHAINNAIEYFMIDAKNGDYNSLKAKVNTLYERAWRKGFEAGKVEGTVKIKEVPVYHDNETYEFNGGL